MHLKPNEEFQRNDNKQNFYNIVNSPNIPGCIDGTHVAIKWPIKDKVILLTGNNIIP